MPGSGSRITECGILAFWQSSCLTFGRDDNDASGNFAPELQALLLKIMPSEMDVAMLAICGMIWIEYGNLQTGQS